MKTNYGVLQTKTPFDRRYQVYKNVQASSELLHQPNPFSYQIQPLSHTARLSSEGLIYNPRRSPATRALPNRLLVAFSHCLILQDSTNVYPSLLDYPSYGDPS